MNRGSNAANSEKHVDIDNGVIVGTRARAGAPLAYDCMILDACGGNKVKQGLID